MAEATTPEVTESTGVEETHPVEAVQTEAGEQTESAETTTTEQTDDKPSDYDEDTLKWFEARGIDPTSADAVAKMAKTAREAEKAMHQSTSKASELQKALQVPPEGESTQTQDDPVLALNAKVQALEMAQNVNTFWASNPDAVAYEPKMAEIVTENPTIGALVKSGYLSVKDLYAMAKGADVSREASLKTEGGREALQKVADKQQGRAVQGQATSSAFSDESKKDPFREALLGKL